MTRSGSSGISTATARSTRSYPNPRRTYTANGVYTARLTVTDSSGKTAAANTTITVGNTAPTVTVAVPVEGGTFAFGDGIPFQVTVTDPEDDPVDCGRVEVTFVLGHDEHGHAGDSTTGCSGVLQTDADDVSHGGNVFGIVSASYTDDTQGSVPALTSTDQNPIRQKRQGSSSGSTSPAPTSRVRPIPKGAASNAAASATATGSSSTGRST